jgi:glycosyltransferase involved in cell wall biosynthesis
MAASSFPRSAPVASGQPASPARLLYVVSEDWAFLGHRLPMARAARDAGFEVHVATKVTDRAPEIAAENFIVHPVPFTRGGISPLALCATIGALRRTYRRIEPAIIHAVSAQAIVLALIAAVGRRVSIISGFTGLGYVFTANAAKAKALRTALGAAFRLMFDRDRMIALVENRDDPAVLTSLGIPKASIVVGRGSGVDVTRVLPLPEPAGEPTVAFVGRLLDDKGIRTLVAAHRILRAQRSNVQLLIAGTPDPANPTSVSADEASSWNNEPGIMWLGHVNDVSTVWARSHIAVLPSRREGLPVALLEAAAYGRPLIATDVPGCREVVINGITGLLVPVDDAAALAGAINTLVQASSMRVQFAAAARQLVVSHFSADIVGQQMVELYRNLLAQRPSAKQ